MQHNLPKKDQKLKILAVEDEDTVIRFYESILGGEGHKIVIASTGTAAKKKLEEEHGFDLILLDLILPDVHGTDLMRQLKDQMDGIPIIIVTANPSLESSIEAIRLGGVYEYIIKPFSAKDLKLTVGRVIDKAVLVNENKRLIRRLECANTVLIERVEELEHAARQVVDYDKKIKDQQRYIRELEAKLRIQ